MHKWVEYDKARWVSEGISQLNWIIFCGVRKVVFLIKNPWNAAQLQLRDGKFIIVFRKCWDKIPFIFSI